ncbi:unnamed protein product [Cunninghamella echinulata]
MAGFAVLTEENSDGTKTTYRIPRWKIYGPIIFFLIFATTFGLVMGLVVIPGTRRRGEEMAAASEKKFNDEVNENHKKYEESYNESKKQMEIDRKRNVCYFNCSVVKCMRLCDVRDNDCRDKCLEDGEACDRNCEKLYPLTS